MATNDKAPAATGACQCAETCLICDCQITTTAPVIQAPRMGTALRAFLRRYVADLISYNERHGDRITRQMIDCGEFLLIEGERLEARQP
jgi:hypothetical protein